MADLDLVRDASRLVHYSLLPRLHPYDDPRYQSLLSRYSDEPDFAATVQAVCFGQHLEVCGATPFGLIIEPEVESVYHFGLREFRGSRQVDNVATRVFYGIALLAIATNLFPRADHLAEPVERIVDAQSVDAMIRSVAESLKARQGASDPAEGEGEPLWRRWLRTNPDGRTERGGLKRSTTQWYIEQTLKFLVEQGLLRPSGIAASGKEGRYRPEPRFTDRLRELAGSRALDALLDERRSDLSDVATDGDIDADADSEAV